MIEKLILRRALELKAPTRFHEYEVYHKAVRFSPDPENGRVLCNSNRIQIYSPGNNFVAGAKTCDLGLGPGEFAWFQVCYHENDPRFQGDRDEDWIEVDLAGNCQSGILDAFDVGYDDCCAGSRVECPHCGNEIEGDFDDHSECPYEHCYDGTSSEWFEDTVWIKKISATHKWPNTAEDLKKITEPAVHEQEELGV